MSRNREKFVECRTCLARELTIIHDGHSKGSAARRLIERCPNRPKMCSVPIGPGTAAGGII